MLTGNLKRKATCQLLGGAKKRHGHNIESIFMKQFGVPSAITYKAEADCVVSPENPEGAKLIGLFPDLPTHRVSIKSGKNLQFTLGRIDEITNTENKIAALMDRPLWEKYLGKSQSSSPANLLAYRKETGWLIFRMSQVIDYIVNNCHWRQLPTGRLKGDFDNLQYLTYEYRGGKHNSHFLGANGNKGYKFIQLLTTKIPTIHVEDK